MASSGASLREASSASYSAANVARGKGGRRSAVGDESRRTLNFLSLSFAHASAGAPAHAAGAAFKMARRLLFGARPRAGAHAAAKAAKAKSAALIGACTAARAAKIRHARRGEEFLMRVESLSVLAKQRIPSSATARPAGEAAHLGSATVSCHDGVRGYKSATHSNIPIYYLSNSIEKCVGDTLF